MPSNVKAGYVIRRILRRAVRYGYTYLGFREPFICRMVPVLVAQMGMQFPELKAQQELIAKVIEEEENAFLRTLATGINLLDQIIRRTRDNGGDCISGSDAFELYDTYGFPIDLTELIAREQEMRVDLAGFERELQKQKERSRNAAAIETDDWVEINNIPESIFVGYDMLECDVRIARYRRVSAKGRSYYQVVFDQTPFYGNSGGQCGDRGVLTDGVQSWRITDTQKENNLTVHIMERLPEDLTADFTARVDTALRAAAAANHSATHLLQKALRKVLGEHVEQKGSMVSPEGLRFDFSHFQKVEEEQLFEVERLVNAEVRANHPLEENRNCTMEEAKAAGAMMLFGEKYGDKVRMVKFGDSVELCGGTHVSRTGSIGFFKILGEAAVSAGVRRIEAVTGTRAVEYGIEVSRVLSSLQRMFNSPKVLSAVTKLVEDNSDLHKELEEMRKKQMREIKEKLTETLREENGMLWFSGLLPINADGLKSVAGLLRNDYSNIVYVAGTQVGDKPSLVVMLGADAVAAGGNAAAVIKSVAGYIQGGGGGQPFLASAGGKHMDGLMQAIAAAEALIREQLSR